MTGNPPIASIAAAGPAISRLAEAHIDLAFRRMLREPRATVERRFVRLVTHEPHPFGNFALLHDPADLEGARAALEPLLTCRAPAAMLFCGTAAPVVVEHLRSAGFEPHHSMPAMAVDIDSLPPTSLPAGCRLERFASGPRGDEWGCAFAEGYELPRGVGAAFSPTVCDATAAPDADIQYFAIRRNGRIVATSNLYLARGIAGIYAVSTLPDERGKGLGAFATAEPLRHARSLGYRVGVLQASPAGHPVYLRLGFRDVGEVPVFIRMPT